MSKLYFDHCFTLDQNHRLLKKLERLGFTLRPTATEHPGGHVCRFIMFKGKVRNQYLEFVHTRPGGDAYSHPGISFGYKGPLESYFKRIKKTLPSEFVHRNYDWKADSKTRLPGWNFLTFKHLGFRTLLPWLTEYELLSANAPPTGPTRTAVTRSSAWKWKSTKRAAGSSPS